ncbi:RES family NAD+ phosphorylase [Sphingomonas sp. H39-1-10]|uniref:RES family NAD+ phosphorylase n=1 Tax=Sphingomonas pollutisoli TaxID=3030829 RepID=UPI0023B8B854|nr:RES family NAD+ phosphorylase [Sphingomonas pollutisoli]MDF0490707.1 RES family NAD+ phosphorylase [Sphingomonas pollutisoli]
MVSLLRRDWALFEHPSMDDFRAKDLLTTILDDGDFVRHSYVPSPRFKSDRLLRWETLRTELMHRNRFFPDTELDEGRLGELLDLLRADAVPTEWFRARIQAGDEPFLIDQMGAPPNRVASHGRANPPGIPYLYVGSAPETAVAEVRPHTGEMATVAKFVIDSTALRLVDLREPRRRVSPFALGDEDKIGSLRSDIAFLERLGEELTRPVLPQGAAIEYVPSQYLCEFIKKAGWDGVIYRSSVSEGMNLALFDPQTADPISVSGWHVAKVKVEVAPVAVTGGDPAGSLHAGPKGQSVRAKPSRPMSKFLAGIFGRRPRPE